jgi:hypothetical protein
MTDVLRTLASGDALLAVWCAQCEQPFSVGDVVVIEDAQPARHVACSDHPADRR